MMRPEIKLVRKENTKDHLTFHDGDLPYFSIPLFDSLGLKNGFTTKFGGVSTGYFSELNMAALKEPQEIIEENYKRVCNTLHMDVNRAVLSYQTHTTNVRLVTESDFKKGIFKPRDYVDTDGLITNMKDVPLFTLYADCVPLYFYDAKNEAIGLSHSGWKGTRNRMGLKTLEKMKECFGTDPKDVYAAVGPSICQSCYEVSSDVADEFKAEFQDDFNKICYPTVSGKYQLDLWKANEIILLSAGILKEHLFVTDICTKCNSDLLYSHRVMGVNRGTLAAVLSL